MKKINLCFLVVLTAITGCSQSSSQKKELNKKQIGGQCEGCEAIYEILISFEQLSSLLWLACWNDKGTRIAINGTVYNPDGTPAPGVILYIYHTDRSGRYPLNGNQTGWGKRHGHL